MKEYVTALQKIESQNAALIAKEQLISEVGEYKTNAVLRISKAAWRNETTRGLFFSVWINENAVSKQKIFHYNLHALKLGALKQYRVKPVTFAKAFRARFRSGGWPNVSTDFGPQNLFQGSMPLNYETFEVDVSTLIAKFVEMHGLIDELLIEGQQRPLKPRTMQIRLETKGDIPGIDSLNRAIFKGDYEAELIKKLRVKSAVLLSMVAVIGEQVVGHILFSRLRVELEGRPVAAAALAPMCVSLKHQRSGVGSSLVKKGLGKLKKLKCEAVIVLGHPAYYQRFGFSTNVVKNLDSPFKGLPSFMGIELVKDALRGKTGFIKYPDPFGIETGN